MTTLGGAASFAVTAAARQAMVTLMTIERQSLAPDDGRWLEQVGRILATLGFALIEPDRTRGDEASHVVVALRAQPTLQHFDPETIDYWITDGPAGGQPRWIERRGCRWPPTSPGVESA